MTGQLTLARRRADEAKCDLSKAIDDVRRPGVDPGDAVRALLAAMIRATAKLEEADGLLGEGILDAAGQYHQIRDLEVEVAHLRGGTEAADRLIDSRPPLLAPRSSGPVPNDEPAGDDLPGTMAPLAASVPQPAGVGA